MAVIQVAVVDENGNPRRGVTVAAYDLDNFPAIQTTAVTNKAGVAVVSVTKPTFIDAFDRRGVSFRDRSYEGKIQIQLVSMANYMNVDYVVDSNGFGTHTTLFGATGAFTDAIADQASRVIWVCTTHTETVTSSVDVSGLANNQYVTVLSGSPYRPTIIADLNAALFTQTAANAGTNWRFIFRGLRMLANTSRTPTFFQPNGGHASTTFEVEDVFFDATGGGVWQYGLDLTGSGSANSGGLVFRKCRGTLKAYAKLAAGAAAVGACFVEQNDMTLTNLFERGSNTQFEAGTTYIINDNNFTVTGTYGMFNAYTFGSAPVPLTAQGNNIKYTGTGVFFGLGTNGSSGVFDQCITGNTFYANAAGASFAAINLGAGTQDIKNVVIAANSLRGPGSGTAITFNAGAFAGTGSIGTIADNFVQNGYREWTTNVHASLAVSGLGGDHGLLSGLSDDDHTQYLLANGTRALTGNWAAGFSFSISIGKLIVDDSNFHLDKIETLGGSTTIGNTGTGGSTDVVSAGEQNATQFTVSTNTFRVTALSARASVNILTRAFRVAVYDDNAGVPNNLLFYSDDITATTTETTFTTTSLRNAAAAVITSYDLAPGTYWISIHVRGGGGFDFNLKYDAAAGTSYENNADTYDDGPENPWSGGSSGTRSYVAYVTGTSVTTTTRLTHDSGDWSEYDRDVNRFQWAIGSTNIAQLDGNGDLRTVGYLNVGSLTAPTNVTDGDINGTRLAIGGPGALGSGTSPGTSAGYVAALAGTIVAESNEAVSGMRALFTITPAANSSSEVRAMYFLNVLNASSATYNIVEGGFYENRLRQGGTVAEVAGFIGRAITVDSSSPATVGAVTLAYGIAPELYRRPSGTSTLAITTGIGLYFKTGRLVGNAGATFTDLYNIKIEDQSTNTITNFWGTHIAKLTRGTNNYEFVNAGKMINTPTSQTLAAAGNTIGNDAATRWLDNSTGASLTLTSTPTVSTTGVLDGTRIRLVNVDSADNIVLQDETALANTKLRLPGAANLTLGPRDSVDLEYHATAGEWWAVGASNN